MIVSYKTLNTITALDGNTVSTRLGDDKYRIEHAASALSDLREIPRNFKNIFTLNHLKNLPQDAKNAGVFQGLYLLFATPIAYIAEVLDPVVQPLLAVKNLFAAGVHGSIAGVETLFRK